MKKQHSLLLVAAITIYIIIDNIIFDLRAFMSIVLGYNFKSNTVKIMMDKYSTIVNVCNIGFYKIKRS